jgi:outer membrane protein OmpA-like peptidoglycan-associated protein
MNIHSMKTCTILGTAGLFLALGSAFAQTPSAPDQTPTPPAATSPAPSANPNGTYATGQPLEQQSKEGFWGHMNPFARKKWVNRQVDPIRDRANELDELQAKNANDIKDVDARATAGISRAMDAAHTADAHAADASTRADQANSVAVTANGRTTALNGTVSNLDQYQPITSADVDFVRGRTTLGPKAKASLDDVATQLASQKGYIVEVQGYSKAGVQTSQAMADSVVRYLVTEHQVPIYRIYRTGLGKQTPAPADATSTTTTASATGPSTSTDSDKPLINGVRVTVLHNSLATMDTTTGNGPTGNQ